MSEGAKSTHDAKLIREVELLVRQPEGSIPSRDASDRRLEAEEAPLLHLSGELASHAARLARLVHNNAATGLVDTLDNGLNLQWNESVLASGDKDKGGGAFTS